MYFLCNWILLIVCICLLIFILFVVDTDIIFKFESRKTWAFKMNKGAQSL